MKHKKSSNSLNLTDEVSDCDFITELTTRPLKIYTEEELAARSSAGSFAAFVLTLAALRRAANVLIYIIRREFIIRGRDWSSWRWERIRAMYHVPTRDAITI